MRDSAERNGTETLTKAKKTKKPRKTKRESRRSAKKKGHVGSSPVRRRAKRLELPPKELSSGVEQSWLDFRTTAELEPFSGLIGQQRAMRAVEVGLNIQTRGFNIYAAGEAGSGKTSTLKSILRERAAREPTPDDLCYVTNFRHDERPIPVSLPAGEGRRLKKAMESLVKDLRRLVSQALSESAFGHIKASVIADIRAKAADLTRKASEKADSLGLRLEETEEGLRVVPLVAGEMLDQETFASLSAEQRHEIENKMLAFQKHLDAHAYARRQLEREHFERLNEAEVRAITPLVDELVEDIRDRFGKHGSKITDYLDQVRDHILENHRAFLPEEERSERESEEDVRRLHRLYEVNLVCDRSDQKGAPVVEERLPGPANLAGCVEYRPKDGALTTDHTMIRAGALHQADGGYLLLQVSDLLSSENGWPCLKRALRHKEARIEESAGLTEGQRRIAGTMKPEPMPIDVKVILVGSQELYYLLKLQDEDFGRLFKVKAEFEPSMEKNRDNVNQLARFLGEVCHREGYLPLHRSGLKRLIEVACRRVERKSRMTTHRAELLDVMSEANYFARQDNARAIRAKDVERTRAEIRNRHGAIADAVMREIGTGSIIIRTAGMAVGQLNGIAIYNLAGVTFGMPVRITARVYAGRRGVVNIDREVNLSGAIHDKGSLILVGYLGGRYACEQTLSLSASITFEQSYDEIDGDSASSAELYAMLSALSGCPIRQGIAVTGSVNQLGEVQPIGGVNDKIEGIFRVCKSRGLTGEEGVMIPSANVKNLMLSKEVIQAVRSGKFHVYAVPTIDEGIEVLTNVPAGTPGPKGAWTEGSINARVQDRLAELQEVVRKKGVVTMLDREV